MFIIKSKCAQIVRTNLRTIHVTSSFYINHYDALGVNPNATQNDIKSAYYKLSMLYHPDKNKGSESAVNRFKDINAAYEVLGNYRLRKLYDKGILQTAGPQFQQAADAEDDAQTKFYKSRMKRTTPPTSSGRTPIYDFDEWSKKHYGDSFARHMNNKKKFERFQFKRVEDKSDIEKETVITGVAIFIFFIFLSSCAVSDQGSHDNVKTPVQKVSNKDISN